MLKRIFRLDLPGGFFLQEGHTSRKGCVITNIFEDLEKDVIFVWGFDPDTEFPDIDTIGKYPNNSSIGIEYYPPHCCATKEITDVRDSFRRLYPKYSDILWSSKMWNLYRTPRTIEQGTLLSEALGLIENEIDQHLLVPDFTSSEYPIILISTRENCYFFKHDDKGKLFYDGMDSECEGRSIKRGNKNISGSKDELESLLQNQFNEIDVHCQKTLNPEYYEAWIAIKEVVINTKLGRMTKELHHELTKDVLILANDGWMGVLKHYVEKSIDTIDETLNEKNHPKEYLDEIKTDRDILETLFNMM